MLCASKSPIAHSGRMWPSIRISNRYSSLVSGEAPQVPVLSPKSGMSFNASQALENRLIASRKRL